MTGITFSEKSHIAHAYIVASTDPEERNQTALRIAAAALCEESNNLPCGKCRNCRKVMRGVHPDVITIERELNEKGKQKNVVSVDQIRKMADEAYILPNEANGKAFILKDAEFMNASAQNAALKIFEEPPAGVVFILCVSKASLLLQTVRSRCAELSMNSMETEDADACEDAETYLNAAATGDPAKIFAACAALEKMDNREATAFVQATGRMAADLLCGRMAKPGLTVPTLMNIERLMDQCSQYLAVNVGIKHIMGMLAVLTLTERAEK